MVHNSSHLKIDTKESEKLPPILTNKYLCKSICNSSNTYQTSQLEAFHSLVLQFASKHTAFSYLGMLSRYIIIVISIMAYHIFYRLQLSVLHYNCNSAKEYAVTKSGHERYCVTYPKYKKGGYIVRKIKNSSKYGL